jgi:AraC-like DNA-binding protein
VAIQAGFASYIAFATAFRQHVGMTPKAYRNQASSQT